MKMYDYLIVGSGLFGAVFAHYAKQRGFKSLVVDRRAHLGGNIYNSYHEGIPVHTYGAHIFHTSNEKVWRFVNKFPKLGYRNTESPEKFFKMSSARKHLFFDTYVFL